MSDASKSETPKAAHAPRSPRACGCAGLWSRPDLSARDRSLVTVAALVALRNSDELPRYLELALQNGVSETELTELMTHLALFADWPSAAAGLAAARKVLARAPRRRDAVTSAAGAGRAAHPAAS